MSELTLQDFIENLAAERNLDLRGYKHTTLERRLKKRMAQLGMKAYRDYLQRIRDDPAEKNHLLDTVLINVTEFFRDPQAWELVANNIIPHILRHKRAGESFRAWVAGCASGEEVYTLAILVAEYLGDRSSEFDIKIYATDVDDHALNIARRGEYQHERLRRMPEGLKTTYFTGAKNLRINREIRRMIIFGKSDLVHDAPISHVDLLVCRNVLIYFDAITQQQILTRFHYALEEGGILFLGKAESKLSDSTLFKPIHHRWRIFRRLGSAEDTRKLRLQEDLNLDETTPQSRRLLLMQIYQSAILDALGSGVMLLDENDIVVVENDAMNQLWGLKNVKLSGKKINETSFAARCDELVPRLAESRERNQTARFTCDVQQDGDVRRVQMTLRPIDGDGHERHGTLILADDVSHREQLQKTIEQLEATGEELQSANEELETTNEELQSTNEELETTNEELQSTNEELETTNEELQSLNEELENMNEELEYRTRELDSLNSRYAETLEQMPWPIINTDKNGRVQFWNSAAERLFGLPMKSVVGLELGQLPIPQPVRNALGSKFKIAISDLKQVSVPGNGLRSKELGGKIEITITPLSRDGSARGALIMFGAAGANRNNSGSAKAPAKKTVKKTTKRR